LCTQRELGESKTIRMIEILFTQKPQEVNHKSVEDFVHFDLRGRKIEDKVKLLVLRDLWNVNWQIQQRGKKLIVTPPENYTKETIREAMAMKRLEHLLECKQWIKHHIKVARQNLASGVDVLKSDIKPVIEVCNSNKQHDLFRILRYYWSSPYSEYVGRRIRLIIRDAALSSRPVIGIAALGSPIIHIPERDEWIGWDKDTRTKNLIYTMDAYVVGALPPYNYLLGGKLVSYILASKEVREIYRNKYKGKVTLIDKRESDKLIGIFTTSLYGKGSQYNRLKYRNELLYKPIGQTKGYGTLHLSRQTVDAMILLIKSKGYNVNNVFGDGPSWVMRVIRAAADILDFDSDFLLRHSFKRSIYFLSFAKNFRDVLTGNTARVEFDDRTMKELVQFWKERWFEKRRTNPQTIVNVREFEPNLFNVEFGK
jgi:hypothetical protein